jgi:hypothetical protein
MPPSDFANADINGIIDKLSIEEAVDLIAGVGLWQTAAIERLGIPAIKVRFLSRRRHMPFNRINRSAMVRMVRYLAAHVLRNLDMCVFKVFVGAVSSWERQQNAFR